MFPERLNKIRKQNHITAKQISDYLGIGIRSYRNYESGHRQPDIETLVKIADYLRVSIDYLVGRDGYSQSHEEFFGG